MAYIITDACVSCGSCVDDVLAVAFGNSLNGALIGAGAAGDTSVSDNVCHDIYLQKILFVFHVMYVT